MTSRPTGRFFIGAYMEGTDTPAAEQAAQAPAESETSSPAVATEQVEAKPDNETAQAKTESEKPTDGDESTDEGSDDSEAEKPKRRSGYDRMKRRALLAEAALEQSRRTSGGTLGAVTEEAEKPPKEEDFNGDWAAYNAALSAHESAKSVEKILSKRERVEQERRAAEAHADLMIDFEERTDEFRKKATDFDEVIGKFVQGGGRLSEYVRDLAMESDKGPELVYFLSKNPAKAAELNSLPPMRAAKEIGALEATLSRPQSKTTKAPPPLKTPSGGATPAADLNALAKSGDVAAYWKMRQQQMKAGA